MDERELLGEKIQALWVDYLAAIARIEELEQTEELLRSRIRELDTALQLRTGAECNAEYERDQRIAELEAELADRDLRPVYPAPADLPSDEALAEALHEAYCAAWPEHYTGDPSWPKLHDKAQRAARIAQARAAKAMLAQWLRARHIDAAEWRRLWKVGHEEWSRPIGTVESTAITILKALGFTVEVSE